MKNQGGFYIGDFNGYGIIVSENKYDIMGKWTNSYSQTRTSEDDGFLNTTMMNARNDSQIAKHVLSLDIDGYTDWYIPSINELKFIYENKDKLSDEYKFELNWYWSSTQYSSDAYIAWVRYFNNVYESSFYKSNYFYVRAIRRFVL